MRLDKVINSYKPLIVIPVVLTLIMAVIITVSGFNLGTGLKGGTITTLALEKPIDQLQLEDMIKRGLNASDVTVNTFDGKTATLTIGTAADIVTFAKVMNGTASISNYQSIAPILSSQALNQVYWALAIAFVFMSITVFIIFKNFVTSIAVILAALSDIIIAAGGMSLFGIPLSVASLGALLLLIGYSVDTDILLTTRVLKRRESSITERAVDAMKTGLTMAAAAIGAMAALYLVTVFLIPSAEILTNIAAVVIVGLIADVLATWLMNLGILRWYMESGRR
jgi:preprotein translocase subunit SecF